MAAAFPLKPTYWVLLVVINYMKHKVAVGISDQNYRVVGFFIPSKHCSV